MLLEHGAAIHPENETPSVLSMACDKTDEASASFTKELLAYANEAEISRVIKLLKEKGKSKLEHIVFAAAISSKRIAWEQLLEYSASVSKGGVDWRSFELETAAPASATNAAASLKLRREFADAVVARFSLVPLDAGTVARLSKDLVQFLDKSMQQQANQDDFTTLSNRLGPTFHRLTAFVDMISTEKTISRTTVEWDRFARVFVELVEKPAFEVRRI